MVVAPFCSCPASLVSKKFLLSAPGVQSVCFFVALRWAPRPFGGARAKKKNTTQGVFFFCSGPGERQGKEKPRWAPARGQSKKKNTTQGVFFFAPAPAKGKGRRSPVGSRHGARKKVFFFALAPCRRPTGLLLPLPFPGPEQKKKPWVVFFFLLWPRAGAQRGFSFPCLSPGPEQKKKTPWVVFFLLWPRAGAQRGFSFPCLSPGPQQKNKIPWVVFFFLLRPRADAHSLTAGLGGDASPSAGWCFFFCCGPARTGVVFFLFAVAPPGRSLTHGGLGRFRQGPGGVFFFCCGPAGSF